MSDKKQSPKKSDGESDKGVVLFEDNIKKFTREEKDITETEDQSTESQQASAYMIKLVLIGDSAVGKTSIRNNYLGLGFEKEHMTTLGADFAATTTPSATPKAFCR